MVLSTTCCKLSHLVCDGRSKLWGLHSTKVWNCEYRNWRFGDELKWEKISRTSCSTTPGIFLQAFDEIKAHGQWSVNKWHCFSRRRDITELRSPIITFAPSVVALTSFSYDNLSRERLLSIIDSGHLPKQLHRSCTSSFSHSLVRYQSSATWWPLLSPYWCLFHQAKKIFNNHAQTGKPNIITYNLK